MKYNKILGLKDHFQPVYDLENEIGMYWKQFIPNEKFYKILSSTIDSLESTKPEEKQSIWLQGTYGTGKSHATSVVKHLLFDELNEISDFEIENTQLKYRLENFRDKNRVFPVVLKGTSNIYDNRTFALVIEKAVKESLKKEGITTNTKTDFDEIISKLRTDEINWENVFSGTELEVFGTKEDIISKLERHDIDILTKIEDILSNKGIHFNKENISKWLEETRRELKERGIADYLMIYWDEFTGIFELPKSGIILTEIQNIAELSVNKGIYLFIVSHRRPYQTDMSKEDIEKIYARFKVSEYSMESITTYQIINASIIKNENKEFETIKKQHTKSIKYLIKKITSAEGIEVQKSLENLFPIHPYTAYLATFMARYIGSTERSVFKFLYDDKYGFKKFIKENPGENGKIFLSSDYLWNFFYSDFEISGNEKIISVLGRFKLFKNNLENEGNYHLDVFKGILLLNILYNVMEVSEASLVSPSEDNIKNLFAGCMPENTLNEILIHIDDQQIINRNPNGLYLLTSSGLPQIEIANEKEKLKKVYESIDSILDQNQKNNIIKSISNLVIHKMEISIMDNKSKEYIIRNKLDKAFNKKYYLHSCLFLGKNQQELQQIRTILQKISSEAYYKDIIFILSDNVLQEKDFDKFLGYRARAIVADKHNYTDERINNDEFAKKIIEQWVDKIKSGHLQWFFRGESGHELSSQSSNKINKSFSKKIFNLGLENIERAQINKNIWDYKKSKKSIEIFLFADNREYIENRTSSGIDKYLKAIIMDDNDEFIVNSNLEFKSDVSDDHPLKSMHDKIKQVIEKGKEKNNFNLGNSLLFLAEPPFGLYQNMINYAAIGFLMREYSGKLYAPGTGLPIQKENMRDMILKLFDFWERRVGIEKLNVRFGSPEEEKLIDVLNYLFNFDGIISLNDSRWKVRDWIKKVGFPIWVFKFSSKINDDTTNALENIFKVMQSIDTELNDTNIRRYFDSIEKAKFDLKTLINQEKSKELFIAWLKSIKEVEISSREYNEVIDFIRNQMQEEVASWTETKTREKVKDWYLKKLKKENQIKPEQTKPEQTKPEQTKPEQTKPEQTKPEQTKPEQTKPEQTKPEQTKPEQTKPEQTKPEQTKPEQTKNGTKVIQTKLESFGKKIEICEEKKLKQAIINVIEEKPEFISILEKYLEE